MGSMHDEHQHHGPGYATPAEAMAAPGEEIVYVAALHTGTGVDEPDFLATVDVDPSSQSYSRAVHRTPRVERVIEPEEIKAKTGLSAPHTVHCMPGDQVVMSMLGNADGGFAADKVIEVPTRDLEGFPVPVPGLITDLVLSMDDRYLYFSNWLHGDLHQYDVPDPANPVLKLRAGDLDLAVDADFFADFSPAKAHEIHLPGGDCTTGIFA